MVSDNITSSWPQDIGNIHVTIWSQTILQQVGLKIMEIYDSSIATKTVPRTSFKNYSMHIDTTTFNKTTHKRIL